MALLYKIFVFIIASFCITSKVCALNNPKIIANSGGIGELPENTLYAIRTVMEAGVDGVEIDLQLTKDNRVVLYNYKDLAIKTDCQGAVEDFTYNDILKCNAAYYFDPEHDNTFPHRGFLHKIPTLEEVLDIALTDNIILLLDLKSLPSNLLIDKIALLLDQKNAWEYVIFLSTKNVHLNYLHGKFPKAQKFESREQTNKRLLSLRNEGICCCANKDSKYVGFEIRRHMMVEDILTLGSLYTKVEFHLWDSNAVKCTKKSKGDDVKIMFLGVNDKVEYNQAKILGVYAVVTNYPIKLLNSIDSYNP
ncbi:MAG: glycerophosphodiester phosphodiesterase family protein [Rickettsiales endosymbiont of Dermacentor nuttalli]